MNASSFSILDTEELTTTYIREEGFPQHTETPATPQHLRTSLICLSRGHPSACQHCYCAERSSSGSASMNVRSTKENFVCFLHHCLQSFEWCQEHTVNANGSLHHSVALSTFYREANSLVIRMPATHESEDPQIV